MADFDPSLYEAYFLSLIQAVLSGQKNSIGGLPTIGSDGLISPQFIPPSGDFKGSVISTDNLGIPTTDIWVIASGSGTFTNFGGIVVDEEDGFNILAYKVSSGSWALTSVPVESSPISNFASGSFTGELDVSGGINIFYNDYISGSVVNLSISALRKVGSCASVRIKGDLTGTIPNLWRMSGDPITSLATHMNELTLMYVSSTDIRVINRVLTGIPPIYGFSDSLRANVTTGATSVSATAGGVDGDWDSGVYLNKAFTGSNNISFRVSGDSTPAPFSVSLTDISVPPAFDNLWNFGIFRTGGGAISVYENGSSKYTDASNFSIGTWGRVSVESGVVKYYKSSDGVSWTLIYTSLLSPAAKLAIKVTFRDSTGTLDNISIDNNVNLEDFG